MDYPNMKQVENADLIKLVRWYRFFSNPGTKAVGSKEFPEVPQHESKLMNRIKARIDELGGITQEVSMKVGWSK